MHHKNMHARTFHFCVVHLFWSHLYVSICTYAFLHMFIYICTYILLPVNFQFIWINRWNWILTNELNVQWIVSTLEISVKKSGRSYHTVKSEFYNISHVKSNNNNILSKTKLPRLCKSAIWTYRWISSFQMKWPNNSLLIRYFYNIRIMCTCICRYTHTTAHFTALLVQVFENPCTLRIIK